MYLRRLRELREDFDLTQSQLAEYLYTWQQTYSNYETGKRAVPLDILCLLAELYGTSTDYLLGRTDEKRPYPCD